jgi:hypothetical protein
MKIRLGQIFGADGFVPSKASLYLKRAGSNSDTAFDLSGGAAVIDATNFSSITDAQHRVVIDDRTLGFSGNGYMRVQQVSGGTEYPSLNYPIRTDKPGKYNVYIHVNTGVFIADVLIDGQRVEAITAVSFDPTWTWITTSIVLPDAEEHLLSFQMKGNGYRLDKVYISEAGASPSGTGPAYTVSPFVTLHLQVFQTVANAPTTPLFVYSWKTTLDEVITDDWYNFVIKPLDGSTTPYSGMFALVLSATGSRHDNFVMWELVDNDEYLMLPSALKVNDA